MFSKWLTVLSVFLEQYVNKLIYDCSLLKILISMSHFKYPCKSQETQDIKHYNFINHYISFYSGKSQIFLYFRFLPHIMFNNIPLNIFLLLQILSFQQLQILKRNDFIYWRWITGRKNLNNLLIITKCNKDFFWVLLLD